MCTWARCAWTTRELTGYRTVANARTQPPKITLKLPIQEEGAQEPPNKRARLNVEGIPDEYEVVMPSERAKNTYVFTEHERTWVAAPGEESSSAKRKREKGEVQLGGRS